MWAVYTGPTVCAIFALGSWAHTTHISIWATQLGEGGGEGETCVVAVGKLCLAGRGSTQVFTFFEQLLACSSVDRTVDAASAEE